MDDIDMDVDKLDAWLTQTLRHTHKPSPEQMLALYMGALADPDASAVREQLRRSPSALAEYAQIAGISVEQAMAELMPGFRLGDVLTRVAASAHEVIRRAAHLLSTPDIALAYRGSGPSVSLYEAPGEPEATIVIEQSELSQHRCRVSGQVAFTDGSLDASGQFLLSGDQAPISNGDISSTGAFDLGALSAGTYRLECLIGHQVFEVAELNIGAPRSTA